MAVNSGETRGWYHQGQSPSGTDHSIQPCLPKAHWDMKDLKEKHKCDGPCSVKFRSPHEAYTSHQKKCGSGTPLDPWSPGFQSSLALRDVDQGCGRQHYDCPSVPDTEHKEQHCTKDYTDRNGNRETCKDRFRKCMYHRIIHNHRPWVPPIKTLHYADGDSDEEANAGGTLHACDIHDTSVSGDHSSTWLCNESPCSNLQVPYCLAICPETGNHGTATTPMHACNIHDTSVSGDHSSTYLCNIPPCSNRIVPYCLALCPYTDTHGTTTITGGDEDTSGGTTPTTPTASLGPDIGYSTTITLGSQTLLVLQASAAFRSVTWYILSPENDSESWMGTYTYSDGATTATYVPYFGGGVGDYQVRVEITPVTGDTYSVSCTVTVQ